MAFLYFRYAHVYRYAYVYTIITNKKYTHQLSNI